MSRRLSEHPKAGHSPAYRQPPRPRIEVPANYRGHAIVDGEERPLGHWQGDGIDLPAEIHDGHDGRDIPTPHFDGLPRVSELGAPARRPSPRTVTASFEEVPSEESINEAAVAEPPTETVAVSSESPPPATRPAGLFDLGNFPFGHGIGMEELLLLGLIWFLLRENADCPDRGDLDETVILLGLLLLLG